MGTFLEEYKILDESCKVLLESDVGVTEYINIMKEVPEKYSVQINGWTDDFKKLKRSRAIRNKIVHEVGKCEENLSTLLDVDWLKNFYCRIKEEQDPLSLYFKIIRKEQEESENTGDKKKLPLWSKILTGGLALGSAIAAIVAAVLSKKDK